MQNLWRRAESYIQLRSEQGKPVKDVSEVIFHLARPYLNKAIKLTAGESFCYILLTLVIKIFLPEVEHPSETGHAMTLYLCVIAATVLSFLTHMFAEHSKAQIFKAKSIAS